MRDAGVAKFLEDADPAVVLEAARAINDDGGIEAALPDLAALLEHIPPDADEALVRRVLSANGRLGGTEHTRRLADFAVRSDAAAALRAEALATLGVWPHPSPLDRVDGLHRGTSTRDAAPAQAALTSVAPSLLADAEPRVAAAATEAAGRLGLSDTTPILRSLARRAKAPEVRVAALSALHRLVDAELTDMISAALNDADPAVRMAALDLIPETTLSDHEQTNLLASVLRQAPFPEQQSALRALGAINTEASRDVLLAQFDRLTRGQWPDALLLELLEAAETHGADTLAAAVANYRAQHTSDNPVVAFREVLVGGDPRRGAEVVYGHEAAQCLRCHALRGTGGDVGPDLAGVGSRLSRERLLEALVQPGMRIAAGYGLVTLTLDDGTVVAGTLRAETAGVLTVRDAAGLLREIPTSRVSERTDGPSAMPPMGTLLSRRELRDAVAYLASLR
jgi:putative heme-binding domain-containing protein